MKLITLDVGIQSDSFHSCPVLPIVRIYSMMHLQGTLLLHCVGNPSPSRLPQVISLAMLAIIPGGGHLASRTGSPLMKSKRPPRPSLVDCLSMKVLTLATSVAP